MTHSDEKITKKPRPAYETIEARDAAKTDRQRDRKTQRAFKRMLREA